MITLALDTVCDSVSCAIDDDGTLLGEIFLHVGLKHSVTLMPAVADLLEHTGIGQEQIGAIAVLKGPGSFTGIRIGISTAAALAYGLGVSVQAVSTLDALIAGGGTNGIVCGILDARRSEVYVKAADDSRVLIEESAMPLADVLARLEGGPAPLFLGDAAIRYRHMIEDRLPLARFLPEGLSYPHAQYAFAAIRRGLAQECSPETLKASYLRPSQAERMRETSR